MAKEKLRSTAKKNPITPRNNEEYFSGNWKYTQSLLYALIAFLKK
jgi:hypothetical protein